MPTDDLRDRLISALLASWSIADDPVSQAMARKAAERDTDTMLAVRDAEVERLRDRVRELEANLIVRAIDSGVGELMQRAERAEEERDDYFDRLRKAEGAYSRLDAERRDVEGARDRWKVRAEEAESRLDGQAWDDLTAELDAAHAAIRSAFKRLHSLHLFGATSEQTDRFHREILAILQAALDAPSGADLSEPSTEKVVVVASRTHDLRVFTGSVEDAREFAASLVEQLRDQGPVSRNPYVPLTTQWTPENWRDAKNDSSSRFRQGITSCAWFGPAGLEVRIEDTLAKPRHIGGRVNAEDCPACQGTNPPYPFICPGNPPESPASGRTGVPPGTEPPHPPHDAQEAAQ
ncbi:hypothetical protein GCM10023196_035870 [Actinoallomurus vinaceus]|uniref:Uncharacterized protein n=1 Tax=Actinoallomurus vinaceus TaxID=1080074 RepID=A0ABP8UCP2_9ACTN